MRSNKRRAFTLVEVLTVIGIVAALTATLFSMLGTTSGRAKMLVCATNMNQIGKSLMIYCADNDDRIPPILNLAKMRGFTDEPISDFAWRTAMITYANSPDIFFCPEDPFARNQGGFPGISRVDHRETSYANPAWLARHVTQDDVLLLNLSEIEDVSSASYLEDDPIGLVKSGRSTEPKVPHRYRTNLLFLDGHTGSQASRQSL